jgi:hypothetical protein
MSFHFTAFPAERRTPTMFRVRQDGADFYNASTGERIYTSRFRVRDSSIADAELAREAFCEWVKAEHPSCGFTWATEGASNG